MGDSGLEPLKPEGEGFTVPCNCRYANLPIVPPTRFERVTYALEVRCSIQLSYGGMFFPVFQRTFVLIDFPKIIKVSGETTNLFGFFP